MIAVDASLFIAWLLNDRDDDVAEAFWHNIMTQPVIVPTHWPNEIANALRRAVRTKRLPVGDIERTARELSMFDIKFAMSPAADDIAGLAMQALDVDLSVYDLQYVRLAKLYGAPLATVDAAMIRAAERLRVVLFRLEK